MPCQSLTELMSQLNDKGYTEICRAEDEGLRFAQCGAVFAPEELQVDHVYRLEGTSAPDEETVLFAISSPDGRVKGTFAAAHGIESDPLDADTMQRLKVPAHATGSGAARGEGARAPLQ